LVVALALCISALAADSGLAQEPQRDPPPGFTLDQQGLCQTYRDQIEQDAAAEQELRALQRQDKRDARRAREDGRRQRACYAAWERATFDGGGARPTARLTPSQARTLDRKSAERLSPACLAAIDSSVFGKGPVPVPGCAPTPKLSARYAAVRDLYRERMAANEARTRQIDEMQAFISQLSPVCAARAAAGIRLCSARRAIAADKNPAVAPTAALRDAAGTPALRDRLLLSLSARALGRS
jgi:hypothetical protein